MHKLILRHCSKYLNFPDRWQQGILQVKLVQSKLKKVRKKPVSSPRQQHGITGWKQLLYQQTVPAEGWFHVNLVAQLVRRGPLDMAAVLTEGKEAVDMDRQSCGAARFQGQRKETEDLALWRSMKISQS